MEDRRANGAKFEDTERDLPGSIFGGIRRQARMKKQKSLMSLREQLVRTGIILS